MSIIRILLIFILLATGVKGQSLISGTINIYTAINAYDAFNNAITVSSSAGFAIGDRVLLIQMQGATISETDDANFGTITNYNNSGNYEILTICDIVGNVVTFAEVMLRVYSPTGSAQMIRIPQYTNATLNGTLTCQPWNGITGGVVILETSGTFDFGTYNIDVSGRGFRGPDAVQNSGSCSFSLDATYYQPFTNAAVLSRKGEGITAAILNKETGRGPQANGGGGGNNHNGGGGGGGNYGYGGSGGQRIKSSAFTCGSYIGLNSKSLTSGYAANKIFMGGGGGAGNGNNVGLLAESGEDGGGIVILIAGTVNGNNRNILADGIDVTGLSDSDGAGGGGAGGTVLLNIGSYVGNLNVSLTGGNGASTDNAGTSNCNGPGGGGGGGVLWINSASLPANISYTATGGTNGIIATTSQTNCTLGSANGAQPGQNGGQLNNLSIPESTTLYAGCVLLLPVGLVQFSAFEVDRSVQLNWQTAFEINNTHFSLYHSTDGVSFDFLSNVNADNDPNGSNYTYLHETPVEGSNYYRLYQTDMNGISTFLGTVTAELGARIDQLVVVPNPATNHAQLRCTSSGDLEANIRISDVQGNVLYETNVWMKKGENEINLDLSNVQAGTYLVHVSLVRFNQSLRFVKL